MAKDSYGQNETFIYCDCLSTTIGIYLKNAKNSKFGPLFPNPSQSFIIYFQYNKAKFKAGTEIADLKQMIFGFC